MHDDRKKIDKWQAKIAKWESRVNGIQRLYPFGLLAFKRDGDGRLHSDDGPAYISPLRCIWYQEGKKHGLDVDAFGSTCFYFENILVPPRFIRDPDSLTFEEVIGHENTEIRYVGIKIYGFDRMRKEERFDVIDTDIAQDGTERELLQCDGVFKERSGTSPPERITLIKVTNSTPHPDGSLKDYYLPIPPDMKTCQQAVAWTFRMEPDEYAPSQET